MKRIWKFIRAVGHHWGILSTGGFFIGIVNLWQNTGHALAKGAAWLIGIGTLLVAFFKSWNEQYERAEALQKNQKSLAVDALPLELRKTETGFVAESETKLSIEVVRAEATKIIHNDFGSFEEGPNGFSAVVMSFRNQLAQPGQQNKTFRRVTANLTFSSYYRTDHIDYGNWLKEYTRYVDFRPGETHTLIVAMRDHDSEEFVTFFNQKVADPRKRRFVSGYTIKGPEPRHLPYPPYDVTITLVSQGTTLFSDVYVLNWLELEFKFSRKQETAEE